MSDSTLPRIARRKRRVLAAEAAIPCATAHTAPATYLTNDRRAEPTFDDLIAGNRREPSHEDLLVDDEDDQDLKPAARELPIAYPGVAVDTMAWLRAQDADDQLPAAAAKAADWLRAQDSTDEQPTPPALQEAPATPAAGRDEHAFDPDRLVPAGQLLTVTLPAEPDEATIPAVGSPRLLFDALDALDRLPSLYTVDAKAFEVAANLAAIQTYIALRPDLLTRHEVNMHLAPITAQLAEVAS